MAHYKLTVTYAAGHTQELAPSGTVLSGADLYTAAGAFLRDLVDLEGRGITRLVAEVVAPEELVAEAQPVDWEQRLVRARAGAVQDALPDPPPRAPGMATMPTVPAEPIDIAQHMGGLPPFEHPQMQGGYPLDPAQREQLDAAVARRKAATASAACPECGVPLDLDVDDVRGARCQTHVDNEGNDIHGNEGDLGEQLA